MDTPAVSKIKELTGRETEAQPFVCRIVRSHGYDNPIKTDDVVREMWELFQIKISKRSIRHIGEWCRLQPKPIWLLPTSGGKGLFWPRTQEEAKRGIADIKSRASSCNRQASNLERDLINRETESRQGRMV